MKFDTAKLPPILNALETDNNGQRLVLEVSVNDPGVDEMLLDPTLTQINSNIWERTWSAALPWMVSDHC